MRAISCRSVLCLVAAWLISGQVAAADNVTITINTAILPVCRFSASAPDTGRNIVAGSTAPGSATGTISYRCTNGLAPAFTISASGVCAACSEAGSTAAIIASEDGGVGRGMGSGRDLTLVVIGPVTQPLQTASAGIISVTVSP